MTLPVHGGDLAAAAERWGRPADGWLDLSTGINPWPYPLPEFPAEAWTRLPGRAEERALCEAAAAFWGCRPENVLAAPGSSALIQALPRLLPPGHYVSIVSPTYGEHARAWADAGHHVSEVAEPVGAEVLVVVNPNNPDGRLHSPESLVDTARLVVVDEAFADAGPTPSAVPFLEPGLVVLRSFGKFWGLAGIRLGFAIAEPNLIGRLRDELGPWPVSGPALALGTAALSDHAWAEATRVRLRQAAGELDAVLEGAGFTVVGGTPLFRLAEHPEAAAIYDRLGRAGILVRAFADAPTRLRFGLAENLSRLKAAL